MNKTILKEFQAMNLQSFSDGQISITFPNEQDLREVNIVIAPKESYYKDGSYLFQLYLPSNYPESAATAYCRTRILHPNIDFSGNICFNLLKDEWNADVRLADYAHGLLWLLYQPNLDSRLNGAAPNDRAEFAKLVHESMQGKVVAGVQFPQFRPREEEPPPKPDDRRFSVEQLIRMFNAPHPPPQPEPFFRMRIPDGRTPLQPLRPTVTPVFATNAPVPPPLPQENAMRAVPAPTPAPAPASSIQAVPAPQVLEPEAELPSSPAQASPRIISKSKARRRNKRNRRRQALAH